MIALLGSGTSHSAECECIEFLKLWIQNCKVGVHYHMSVFCSLNSTPFTQWKTEGKHTHTRKCWRSQYSPPALDSSWLAPLLQNIGRETERALMTCGALGLSPLIKNSPGQTDEPLVPAAEQSSTGPAPSPRPPPLCCFLSEQHTALGCSLI